MAINTRANFANALHRGFRAPNRYSVVDEAELATLGSTHAITVRNGRELDPPASLDVEGFQLVNAPFDGDLMDQAIVRSAYYAHCREVLAAATGCDEVRGGGHEYRTGYGGTDGPRKVRATPNGSGGAYAQGIHSDMCAAVEDAFGKLMADDRHFESVNLWRSTNKAETVQMMPLAVCDMTSVRPGDIVFGDGTNTSDIRMYRKVVDQRLIHSPEQRWYYFPDMTGDEVLLFRQYDTRQPQLNMRTVFHQAVEDPKMAPDAPMRSTIEVRMQPIYGFETNKADRKARFKAEIPVTYRDGRSCDWWSGPIEGYTPPDQRT